MKDLDLEMPMDEEKEIDLFADEEGAEEEAAEGVDLSDASDEDLIAEMKKRDLLDDEEEAEEEEAPADEEGAEEEEDLDLGL